MIFKIIFILIGLVIVLFWLCYYLLKKLRKLSFLKKSLSSKYGKMTEQFLPFLENYPYDEQNFRFIGSPIDGIQFEDDKIIFVEFKVGDSKLTEREKKIKEQVERKKVEFEEFRIE